jgi:hypothetical protein
MNKEGHLGVVKSTEKPIVKGALKYLAQGKLNDSLDAGGLRNGGSDNLPKSRQQSNLNNNYMQGMHTLPLQAAAE